jgi:hypothetical protein
MTRYPPYSSLLDLFASTYDHWVWNAVLPVRSAILKPHAGRLVLAYRQVAHLKSKGKNDQILLTDLIENR